MGETKVLSFFCPAIFLTIVYHKLPRFSHQIVGKILPHHMLCVSRVVAFIIKNFDMIILSACLV